MGMRAGELRNPWNKRNEDNIIQMAREEYARTFMHRRLQSMTACVDTSGPKASNMKHLELRLKKVQLQEDRRQTIARDNRKLMEKMTDIIKGRAKAPLYSPPAMVLKGSLNERERRVYVDKVNSDNKLLLQRLKTQTAYINVPKMEAEYQKWLEHRKMCSRAYKRQRRAQQSARHKHRQKDGPRSLSPLHDRANNHTPGTADSDPLPGSTNSTSQSRGLPFRTAKQLKDGLLREPGPHSLLQGGGGFVPLPSLVQLPPASAQPTYNYSDQDKGGHKVGDVPVQFAIHHQGSAAASAAKTEQQQPVRDASPERPSSVTQGQQGEVGEQTSSLTLPPA